jgi:hypothetical protein
MATVLAQADCGVIGFVNPFCQQNPTNTVPAAAALEADKATLTLSRSLQTKYIVI